MNTEQIITQITEIIVAYGPKFIGAVLVWIIGSWIVKALTNIFVKTMDKAKTDESLKPFLKGIVSAALKIMLVITVFGMIGIKMTSFIAILAAAGLAIGMALSGTLQNFSGGVMILLFKPFKVGDLVDAQGYLGTVNEIQIFNTILKTPDNKTIILPNGSLSNSSMTNYSKEELRRVDWSIGIGYGDDVDKAKDHIIKLCNEDSRILKDPAVMVAVSELADSSVNLVCRAWATKEDYWDVFFELNEKVYKTFDKNGLNIPFPQMDVHLHKENDNS